MMSFPNDSDDDAQSEDDYQANHQRRRGSESDEEEEGGSQVDEEDDMLQVVSLWNNKKTKPNKNGSDKSSSQASSTSGSGSSSSSDESETKQRAASKSKPHAGQRGSTSQPQQRPLSGAAAIRQSDAIRALDTEVSSCDGGKTRSELGGANREAEMAELETHVASVLMSDVEAPLQQKQDASVSEFLRWGEGDCACPMRKEMLMSLFLPGNENRCDASDILMLPSKWFGATKLIDVMVPLVEKETTTTVISDADGSCSADGDTHLTEMSSLVAVALGDHRPLTSSTPHYNTHHMIQENILFRTPIGAPPQYKGNAAKSLLHSDAEVEMFEQWAGVLNAAVPYLREDGDDSESVEKTGKEPFFQHLIDLSRQIRFEEQRAGFLDRRLKEAKRWLSVPTFTESTYCLHGAPSLGGGSDMCQDVLQSSSSDSGEEDVPVEDVPTPPQAASRTRNPLAIFTDPQGEMAGGGQPLSLEDGHQVCEDRAHPSDVTPPNSGTAATTVGRLPRQVRKQRRADYSRFLMSLDGSKPHGAWRPELRDSRGIAVPVLLILGEEMRSREALIAEEEAAVDGLHAELSLRDVFEACIADLSDNFAQASQPPQVPPELEQRREELLSAIEAAKRTLAEGCKEIESLEQTVAERNEQLREWMERKQATEIILLPQEMESLRRQLKQLKLEIRSYDNKMNSPQALASEAMAQSLHMTAPSDTSTSQLGSDDINNDGSMRVSTRSPSNNSHVVDARPQRSYAERMVENADVISDLKNNIASLKLSWATSFPSRRV